MATQSCSRAQHATLSGTTADLINFVSVQVVTIAGSVTAGDSFAYQYGNGFTAAFVAGTNMTAAAMQSALRTLTGDSGLTVSGSTDAGPFTITFVNLLGDRAEVHAVRISSSTITGVTTAVTSPKGYALRVTNHDSSIDLYFNVNSATVPTGAADDTYYVAPGTSVVILPGGTIDKCRVVGNGNVYSVEIA